MQQCLISVTLWLTYTDDICVQKLVRPWQFTAAIRFYILLTQLTEPPQFQERAGFAPNALKCRSHSAEDAGLTSSSSCAIWQYRIRLFVLFPPIKWVKNISCSVNFGRSMAKVHRPVTHMTHCLLCPEHTPYSENLPFCVPYGVGLVQGSIY